MKSALISGGTGFVGGNVARRLVAAGWKVIGVHRESTSRSAIDRLRDTGAVPVPFRRLSDLSPILREESTDVIFHLAAHQTKDPPDDVELFVDANVALGTWLLEGAAEVGCVVVNAMSYSQFRHGEAVPASLYSATKQALLVISEYYGRERGVELRNVVLYDNYGPRDPRDKLVNQLVDAIHGDGVIGMGPEQQRINLLHVDDVSAGLIAASEKGNPSLMTVRADSPVSVGEIARELERISGRQLTKTFDESRKPSDQPEIAGDWPLPLDWEPRWRLEDGLREVLETRPGA